MVCVKWPKNSSLLDPVPMGLVHVTGTFTRISTPFFVIESRTIHDDAHEERQARRCGNDV